LYTMPPEKAIGLWKRAIFQMRQEVLSEQAYATGVVALDLSNLIETSTKIEDAAAKEAEKFEFIDERYIEGRQSEAALRYAIPVKVSDELAACLESYLRAIGIGNSLTSLNSYLNAKMPWMVYNDVVADVCFTKDELNEARANKDRKAEARHLDRL